MTETTVHYHVEDGVSRPAINVKVHAYGTDFWPDGTIFPQAGDPGEHDRDYDAIVGAACERVTSDFWQAAEEIATQRGLGPIEQQGRSGGWLVFTECDPNDPTHWKEVGEIIDWLAGYRAMVEWADTFIADAPRKVATLAQQYAMDDAGEGAALRMFAFEWERMPYRQLMRATSRSFARGG